MKLTIQQIKKSSTARLTKYLSSKEIDQETYEIIKSVLLYREETAEKMERAGVHQQAINFIEGRPDLQFEIVNRPMGVKSDGKFVEHADAWYWPFHTGIGKPIGKYPCLPDSPKMQNKDLVELGLKIAGGIGAKITKAVAMKDGASFLLGLEMPERIEVGEDVYEQYIYILDNRTGEHGLRIGFGNVCLRCQNQMRFVKKNLSINVKHTASMHDKLQVIVDNIDLARQEQEELFQLMRELQKVEVSSEESDLFIRTICGYDESAGLEKRKVAPAGMREYNALISITEKEFSQVGRTAYGLLQGVTNLVTHEHQSLYRKVVAFDEAITYDKGATFISDSLEMLKNFVAN